jgi:DnaJ-class molecular chaperone
LVPQNNFKLEGKNFVFTKEININEAKNDPHIIIPHPDGEMKIRIPNNGSTKTPLRIRGKGYDPNSSDLFVKLEFFLNDLIN